VRRRQAELPAAGSAAVEAQQALGEGVRVVSALQNIGADKLASAAHIDACAESL
jgi:predicted dinucleotide-binding enzyme